MQAATAPVSMIFIAGIFPKTKVIDQNPRKCPVCGSNRAAYQRIDHYLSLFFIPVLRVKKGEPFIRCEQCERSFHDLDSDIGREPQAEARECRYCRRKLARDYRFCPYCGKKL
jgi:uncharacterized CHY-type Zn-finger protein